MNIIGLGTDIVSIPRIADLVQRHGDRFLGRCFRPGEIEYAASRGLGRDASLAARWAAKEAFLKALGTSVTHIPYHDIEVVKLVQGPVGLKLYGKALASLDSCGGADCLLSLSHEREFALATVLLLGSQ